MVEMTTQFSFSNPSQNIDKETYSPQKDVPDFGLKEQSKTYKYKCNICHKVYNRKPSLKYHEKIHKSAEREKLFVCSLCENFELKPGVL